MRQGGRDDATVLIEATANQVNQFGGYTGMCPADFRARVGCIARKAGIDADGILLGGDHLGPVCWTGEPVERALAKARELVAAYVAAGFKKIHLDTSMPCADDPEPLTDATVAARAAALCQTAERVAFECFGESDLLYVIGTEVPAPGGETAAASTIRVTEPASARATMAAHEAAFRHNGLDDAWARVIALVVQPGVDFGNDRVHSYAPDAAKRLSQLVADVPKLVFEAHSTDYQSSAALAALVRDHFAILKVGPELTYALREALFALSYIEAELVPEASQLPAVCERAMLREPAAWQRYCSGDGLMGRAERRFGYSDRIRYYWADPAVSAAVDRLLRNLSGVEIPLPVIEQHMPLQYASIRAGELERCPKQLVLHHVMRVTGRYARACGGI